jgi:hypothetical protein
MKRNEKVGFFVGLLIVAALFVIFRIFPQADVIPGFVLMPLAIVATIFVVWRQKRRAKGQGKLVFGRFKLWHLLMITMGVPIVGGIVGMLITKIVRPDLPPVTLFAIVMLGFVFALAGFFFSMSRYIWTNRDW